MARITPYSPFFGISRGSIATACWKIRKIRSDFRKIPCSYAVTRHLQTALCRMFAPFSLYHLIFHKALFFRCSHCPYSTKSKRRISRISFFSSPRIFLPTSTPSIRLNSISDQRKQERQVQLLKSHTRPSYFHCPDLSEQRIQIICFHTLYIIIQIDFPIDPGVKIPIQLLAD